MTVGCQHWFAACVCLVLCGCGTSEYQSRFRERLDVLSKTGQFDAFLHKTRTVSGGLSLRLPKYFDDKSITSTGNLLPGVPSTFTYERPYADSFQQRLQLVAIAGPMPGFRNDVIRKMVLEAAKTLDPKVPAEFTQVTLNMEDGTTQAASKITLRGMTPKALDDEKSNTVDSLVDVYIVEQDTRLALVIFISTQQLAQRFDYFAAGQACIGTLKFEDPPKEAAKPADAKAADKNKAK